MRRQLVASVTASLAIAASIALMQAQGSPGEQVFKDRCASCHTGAADSRAPAPEALRGRTPQAIVEALVNGAMRAQGSRMTGAERRAVAEFLTGRSVEGDVSGAATGRCATAPAAERTGSSNWRGWSPTTDNTRFQSAEGAAITAAEIPKLTLRWAFGFPDASSAWAQPSVADGRVYVGSQNGTVYALDARSGCVRWTFAAAGGVRTAVTLSSGIAYFGDTAANVYAVDAQTGVARWRKSVEQHPLARITGSVTVHDGRLYVPTSSYEESQGADPQYPCCTFRGSVTALDAGTGAVAWKTYMIPEEPKRRGSSSAGVPLWGPSGAAIWSAPTIDARRGLLYVATGNLYSGPAHTAGNAVVAIDLKTGSVRWSKQFTPGDVYVSNCRAGNPNCPEANGPDFDFGSPPMLARTSAGRDLIVIGQKSGVGFALDPEKMGEVVWEYRAGRGGVLGGIEWGSAVDAERAYFAVSDILLPQPGGLHAVTLATGQRAWFTPPRPPACGSGRGCNAAQSAAVTVIPGAVFSGSNDGALRVYSTADGAILWEFDSNREFTTVNGVAGRGASMIGPGPVVAGGMVFVSSGYGAFGGRPGNVLLAFAPQ
ncbi:MAG TPA: PQQ-binding-like beta-propeller repeat protein [Vicinamibacterales bacterium]|jgi:polyvinyl alcohol dehydrogenase (cytochrome)|nr:PQQ-binding-like beta-propeller repeat protein [Vicinamibacterales bacterium]